MAVEDHADIPDEQPSLQTDRDPVIVHGEQPQLGEFMKLLDLLREIGRKADRISLFQLTQG